MNRLSGAAATPWRRATRGLRRQRPLYRACGRQGHARSALVSIDEGLSAAAGKPGGVVSSPVSGLIVTSASWDVVRDSRTHRQQPLFVIVQRPAAGAADRDGRPDGRGPPLGQHARVAGVGVRRAGSARRRGRRRGNSQPRSASAESAVTRAASAWMQAVALAFQASSTGSRAAPRQPRTPQPMAVITETVDHPAFPRFGGGCAPGSPASTSRPWSGLSALASRRPPARRRRACSRTHGSPGRPPRRPGHPAFPSGRPGCVP